MKAEDTVMNRQAILNAIGKKFYERFTIEEVAKAQAEISLKAGLKEGIWLFAWWKDGVQYVGTSGKTLEEAYKELGID